MASSHDNTSRGSSVPGVNPSSLERKVAGRPEVGLPGDSSSAILANYLRNQEEAILARHHQQQWLQQDLQRQQQLAAQVRAMGISPLHSQQDALNALLLTQQHQQLMYRPLEDLRFQQQMLNNLALQRMSQDSGLTGSNGAAAFNTPMIPSQHLLSAAMAARMGPSSVLGTAAMTAKKAEEGGSGDVDIEDRESDDEEDMDEEDPQATMVPCKARGMPPDHDEKSALLVVREGIKHGDYLLCSHPVCRSGGVKFRYCLFCKRPVAKRSFRTRHDHSSSKESVEEEAMEATDATVMKLCGPVSEQLTQVNKEPIVTENPEDSRLTKKRPADAMDGGEQPKNAKRPATGASGEEEPKTAVKKSHQGVNVEGVL